MALIRGVFGRKSTKEDTFRLRDRLKIGQRNLRNHATNRVGPIMHLMLTSDRVIPRNSIGAGDRLRDAWLWADMLARGYTSEEIVRVRAGARDRRSH